MDSRTEKYLNDNIHPCIRYVPDGFAGHKWWMVTTPILGGSSTENPILYWGDSREGELPPLTWSGDNCRRHSNKRL